MQEPAWTDVSEDEDRNFKKQERDRDIGFPSVMEYIGEAVEESHPAVIIVSHGRFDNPKRGSDEGQGKQGGQTHYSRKMPTRRDSTDIDWTVGADARPLLSSRQRLQIRKAMEVYDTAFEQFVRLYAGYQAPKLDTRNKQCRDSILSPFVPEVHHVHVAYTAVMHAYLHLIVLERDFWDAKSHCLGVESLFAAFRSFLGLEYRGVVDWPIDFDARLPSMEGYYERLKLQHDIMVSKGVDDAHGSCTEDDGAVEEVSDFEDDIDDDKQASARQAQRLGGTRRRGSSERPRNRRKTSQASSTSAQGLHCARRRSG